MPIDPIRRAAPPTEGPLQIFLRRAWWLVPELIAVITIALLIPATNAGGQEPADPFKTALADRVVAAMEAAPPSEHEAHGHVVEGNAKVVCVAEVYGVDPTTATTVDQVQVVYGYLFCASGAAGIPFGYSSRMTSPYVMDMNTKQIRLARSGLGYPDRVRELMPDRYEEQALKGFADHRIPGRLQPRYESAVGKG